MFSLVPCEGFPLTQEDGDALWNAVRIRMNIPDTEITLQCVSREEIQRLNLLYRQKDAPTNVLTFSYGDDDEHDIALCMDVANAEAGERGIALRDYVALLTVHALLHACGVDHEKSHEDLVRMESLEREVLSDCGFVSHALSDVY